MEIQQDPTESILREIYENWPTEDEFLEVYKQIPEERRRAFDPDTLSLLITSRVTLGDRLADPDVPQDGSENIFVKHYNFASEILGLPLYGEVTSP